MVGGHGMDDRETNTVFMCSMKGVVDSSSTSQAQANTWSRVVDLPVVLSTCVSIRDRLLTVGGKTLNNAPSSAVYMYNPASNSC